MKWLQCAALLAVTWLCCEGAYTLHKARPKVIQATEDVSRTTIIVAGAATDVEKGLREWKIQSKEQAELTTASIKATSLAASNVNVAAIRLTSFISSTDNSVNSRLIPALTTSIEQQNAALLVSQLHLQANLEKSESVLIHADERISDPDIKLTLDNVAISSANLATATREGAASMTDIHTALDYELKQLMAPVTKLQVAGKVALVVLRHLYF